MLVRDIMTDHVHTVSPTFSIKEAAEAMSKRNIGSLIVVSSKKLEGIITERDIMSKVVSKGKNASTVKVRDVMSKKLVFIEPDCDMEEAAEMMVKEKIKRLPVVEHNRLIGIITAMDIVTAEPKMTETLSTLVSFVKKKNFVAG
jgi:CBS domain-containing protein